MYFCLRLLGMNNLLSIDSVTKDVYLYILLSFIILVIILITAFYLVKVKRDKIKLQSITNDFQNKNLSYVLNQKHTNTEQKKEMINQLIQNSKKNETNSNDHVLLEIPKELRSTFTDFLKGFEDFAKLKGYNVSYSADNSVSNSIAYKITLNNDLSNFTSDYNEKK